MILLDVSRLISRLGQGPLTGIDRVEREWLEALQGRDHRLLARVVRRQLLLGPEAGALLLRWLDAPEAVPMPRGLVAALRRVRTPRAQAEEVLAGMALGTGGTRGFGLGRALRRLPAGSAWLAVGHANLHPGPWRAIAPLRKAVMIHDTIPLDFPEYTRAGQDAAFGRRLAAALTRADLILTVSEATRADVIRCRDRFDIAARPEIVAAPIGTTLAEPRPDEIPPDLPRDRPFFIALGTIEPRKNHALLLDAWERLGPEPPRLLILGRRGWENAAVFARLDALPHRGPVIERAGLSDGAVAALMGEARALLMPSHAEGFGMPLAEAAARGLPVLATPLPAAREVLGSHATWLDADDPGAWATEIARLAAAPPRREPVAMRPWRAHVAQIMRLLGQPEEDGGQPGCPAG
ncbi:glycosyltransferase family 4 protein [Paracoccus sp. S-4012]|uniref:glycosyltransferase family 4 protein n=1 Tax=Paracoccus sp. S-4012 TaxID=2665648 RepID=UPI00351B856B